MTAKTKHTTPQSAFILSVAFSSTLSYSENGPRGSSFKVSEPPVATANKTNCIKNSITFFIVGILSKKGWLTLSIYTYMPTINAKKFQRFINPLYEPCPIHPKSPPLTISPPTIEYPSKSQNDRFSEYSRLIAFIKALSPRTSGFSQGNSIGQKHCPMAGVLRFESFVFLH